MPIIVLISIPMMIGLFALFGAFSLGQVQVAPAFWVFVKFVFGGVWVLWIAVSVAKGASEVMATVGDVAFSFSDLLDKLPINDRRHKIPEVDRRGTVIAYRYFQMSSKGVLHSVGAGMVGKNPITKRERGSYKGGWNTSDRIPTLKNTHGIYAAKTWDSPILKDYQGDNTVLAKVELSGRIVEGEYGYRAQHCRIVETYGDQHGNR